VVRPNSDELVRVSKDRLNWGDKYPKKRRSRWKIHLCASDFHGKELDPFCLRVFTDVASRCDPDCISVVGDLFDCTEFSSYPRDPEDWDPIGDVTAGHSILRKIRESAPASRIVLQEGNHEYRIARHFLLASPSAKGILCGLHGISTLGQFFKLDEFNVDYQARGSLVSWTKREADKQARRNYSIYEDCFMAVHDAKNKRPMHGVCGHLHFHRLWTGQRWDGLRYEWHQMGCMCRREASYAPADHWSQGFCIANIDSVSKNVQIEHIDLTGGFCWVGGKHYERRKNEV
jgi:hypothetical protein